MIISVHDDPTPSELSEAIAALGAVLEEQGARNLGSLYLNCFVWAGDGRLQIVRPDRTLGHINIVRNRDKPGWKAIPDGTFRIRPNDQPYNPLAILANHDD